MALKIQLNNSSSLLMIQFSYLFPVKRVISF